MSKICTIVALVLTLGAVQTASGQSSLPARGFVVVNGGYQLATNDFTDGATKRENAEDGRFDTTYAVKGGPALDVAGGAMIWRRLGAGVGVSRFSTPTPSTLKSAIPHPFFFNRPRAISADVAGLSREEQAIHLHARAVFPAGDRFQIMLFGGPSFFRVTQTMITDYSYTESYPYDEATIRAVTTTNAKVTKTAFNAGADLAFFFTRQIGVGITIQFSGTSLELPGASGTTKVKVGGGQTGAGLRLRF